MSKSIEELSTQFKLMMKQFVGFQSMMRSTLDSLDAIGLWQATADSAFDELREKAEGTTTSIGAVTKRMEIVASRMDALEARLVTAPPVNLTPNPAQPPIVLRGMDLNMAPGSSTCSPALDGEWAKGRGEHCGGILGSRQQDYDKGTFPISHTTPDDAGPAQFHSPPFPKMEFPKFDGEFPRLWRDQCEVFFEVYAVHPSLKTRFATLNFKGVAMSWLQTVQRKGRISDWEKLCELVMAKFDKNQYQLLLKQFDVLK